jgi:integrase
VPISNAAVSARKTLRAWIERLKRVAGDVPVFDRARKAVLAHRLASRFSADHDLVFPNPIGEPQNPAVVLYSQLKTATQKAGLPAKAVRFHGLRHLAVSAMIAQGAQILTVSRIAGHSDPSITLKVYSHLLAEDLVAAADKFDLMRQVV